MGKILEYKINRFDGGISNDVRNKSSNQCAMIKHFDIFSHPYKISPMYSSTAMNTIGSVSTAAMEYNIQDFQPLSTNSQYLYGIGVNGSGSNVPTVLSWYLSDNKWTVKATAVATAILKRNTFIEWQGDFYFLTDNT